jgi:hypothetical protein
MFALVVIEDSSVADLVLRDLQENTVRTIIYHDPIKVIDNIAEIKPDVLIIRQKDFPLHAPLIASMVRFSESLQHCRIVIIGDEVPSLLQCWNITEEKLQQDAGSLARLIFNGAAPPGRHRGGLAAKAQRMVKE